MSYKKKIMLDVLLSQVIFVKVHRISEEFFFS